jgi:hypothetical protein
MPAYTDSIGFNKGVAAFMSNYTARASIINVPLDFAVIAAARVAAGAAALAATDSLDIIPVPAGSLVLAVGVQVTRAEGATATIDIGDAASATRYLSNADLNAIGTSVSALTSPFYYAANGVIRVTFDHNSIDAALARLFAVIVNCNA